jgi:hypothetical protein
LDPTRPGAQSKNDLLISEVFRHFTRVLAMILKMFCAARQQKGASLVSLVMIVAMALGGCVVYEPVPAPQPRAFVRPGRAAVGGAQDEGVRITSEDRTNGVIRGLRDEQEVTINIRSQADGSVRVEMSARGPKGSDPGLAGRISRAYDRRMGR